MNGLLIKTIFYIYKLSIKKRAFIKKLFSKCFFITIFSNRFDRIIILIE